MLYVLIICIELRDYLRKLRLGSVVPGSEITSPSVVYKMENYDK